MSDELEQVRAISRALPFAHPIEQGKTLRRDHLEASFMNDARTIDHFKAHKLGAKNYYAMMAEYDALP